MIVPSFQSSSHKNASTSNYNTLETNENIVSKKKQEVSAKE